MTLLGKTLGVALPDTVLEEKESPRDKTVKLGVIARACATYGVDLIEVFKDEKGRGESRMIRRVLEYLETPQYLRKRLFPFDDALKYAGLLPPLRIPSHKQKVPLQGLKLGEVREGVVNEDGSVDIGLEEMPRLTGRAVPRKRVTVRVTSKDPFVAEVIARESAGEYWGYEVESRTTEEVVADKRFDLRIATSRRGEPLQSTIVRLRDAVARSGSILVIFGSPARGLFEIAGEGLAQKVRFVLNLYAEQQVETVRTEEAVGAALNLMNILSVLVKA